jgi:uncharacterized protein (DUF849 family)
MVAAARIERIKACLNGGRDPREHPAIPVTPAELAVAAASEILDRLPPAITAPELLDGEDDSCWPLIAHAGRLGLRTRIGLEDVTSGPSGDPVTGNADLVGRALARWLQCSGAEPGS